MARPRTDVAPLEHDAAHWYARARQVQRLAELLDPRDRCEALLIALAYEDLAKQTECSEALSAGPAVRPVSLLELTEKTCRWPLGDPRIPDFGFCGATPVAGQPYCVHHLRLAHRGR